MERLDFASVMAVIRININEDCCPNQVDLIWTLFRDVAEDEDSYMEFDNGQVCRWLSGIARPSPIVTEYYRKNTNRRKLAQRIQEDLLPMMPDAAMAAQELCDLVLQATNVSPRKKADLTEGLTFDEEEEQAIFMMEILCFAMELRFEKRDIRKKHLPSRSVPRF